MTKNELRQMIQEAVKEQLSRKAAPLPTWGVHSTPEKSPWGIKEPSELYPEDDGSEDSDLEPFPWEQEVYDKHNASEDAKRREWDQNNDDGTIYGEQVSQSVTALDIEGIRTLLRQIEDKIYSYESQETDRVSRRKATESRSELRVWLRKLIYKMADA